MDGVVDDERRRALGNVAGGAAQATLVTIVGYPFDTVKSRMQSGMFRNSWECACQTFRVEGLRSLYRGGTMPWLSHLVKRPLQFPISEALKRQQVAADNTGGGGSHVLLNNYVIGGVTGPVGSVFGTPLQVVKVGMQTSRASDHTTSGSFIRHHLAQHGVRGFYRGFVPTLMKDCLFGASFVGHYYTLRDLWGTDRWYKNFASGAIAHCATWALLMPIDFVKTTIQRSTQATSPSIQQVLSQTVRQQGVTAFWRGIGPACARTIPVSGIAMTGYEMVRKSIGS